MSGDPLLREPFKCCLCNYEGATKYKIKEHMVEHRDLDDPDMYKCPLCDHKTKRLRELRSQHMLKHKDPLDIKWHDCDICCYTTKYKGDLKRHMLRHVDLSGESKARNSKYLCTNCPYQTNRKSRFERHKCSPSGLKVTDKQVIHIHALESKASPPKKYKCRFCDHSTRTRYELNQHLIRHQSQGQTYNCELCKFTTKYKCNLATHIQTHVDPSEIDLYHCDVCDFKTKIKYNLRVHKLRHIEDSDLKVISSELSQSVEDSEGSDSDSEILRYIAPLPKTHRCIICGHETGSKKVHTSHMASHKDPSDPDFYGCICCTKKMKSLQALQKHILTHSDSSEPQGHKCSICNLACKCKEDLKRHMSTHFKCSLCDLHVSSKSNLKRHMLVHKKASEKRRRRIKR